MLPLFNGHGPAEVVNSAAASLVALFPFMLPFIHGQGAAVVSNPSASSGSFVPVYAASFQVHGSDAVNPRLFR